MRIPAGKQDQVAGLSTTAAHARTHAFSWTETNGIVDLGTLPVQWCWPGDAGPLITWGLTVTRGPQKARQNLGIYRQQVIAPNKVQHHI